MAFLITQLNRDRYEKELDQIFQLRHEVFVETLGWRGLNSDDGRERDQFDNDDALYLATRDRADYVVGCMRLNPTTSPSLTATVFQGLVQFYDLPSLATVYDISRYAVSPRAKGCGQAAFHGVDLVCAAFELGLSEQWTAFTAVLPVSVFSSMLQNSVEVNALGFPASFEGQDYVAVTIPIRERSLQKLYEGSGGCRPRLRTVTFHERDVVPEPRTIH